MWCGVAAGTAEAQQHLALQCQDPGMLDHPPANCTSNQRLQSSNSPSHLMGSYWAAAGGQRGLMQASAYKQSGGQQSIAQEQQPPLQPQHAGGFGSLQDADRHHTRAAPGGLHVSTACSMVPLCLTRQLLQQVDAHSTANCAFTFKGICAKACCAAAVASAGAQSNLSAGVGPPGWQEAHTGELGEC